MNYEKFLNIAAAIVDYTNYNRNVFIDFGYCVKYNLISDDDVDFFKELKAIYLKSRPCKRSYESYIRPEILACAIIIVKYPDETFENARSEKTKVKYISSDRDTLLKKAKLLDSFMMSI